MSSTGSGDSFSPLSYAELQANSPSTIKLARKWLRTERLRKKPQSPVPAPLNGAAPSQPQAMASFANSFWSQDYAGGLGVLFGKIQQGVQENQQVLTIARLRAESEELYGLKLGEIGPATDRIPNGFSKDDGASVRKAYEGLRSEMDEASKNHRKIASNIRELVVNPFSRWCESHTARVQHSQDALQAKVKQLDKQAEAVRKLRSTYYNKCRLVEDLEEEDKLAFQDPQAAPPQSPKLNKKVPTIKEPDYEEEEPMELGGQLYEPDEIKRKLMHMLETIPLREAKVPILGTYQNVSTGADITDYIQTYLGAQNVSYAEEIGQDMISLGLLRLIGNVGNTFTNTSRMNYQWKTKVFKLTGIPEKNRALQRASSALSTTSDGSDGSATPIVGTIEETLQRWNPLNNPHKDETPPERLRREQRESDERYKMAVRQLDSIRCSLEEDMFVHLRFMERCELDRLKAIKAVILDFSGAISNVIPSLQSTVDNMMLFQETVQPLGDLRYLLENYKTGQFVPKVTVYENYYNSVDEQTFGVDLEARARSDKKRVPIIVTSILTYLDNHYPDLEGDEARRSIWLVDVPLQETHKLRAKINTGKLIPQELFEEFDIPVVAAVLKLYLLELPDSLVSSHVYEIVKTIYSATEKAVSDEARISVVQSTLGQLRLANIATLDALTTHFTRLIDLTSANEEYTAALASNLAPCVLRPRQETSLSMTERWNYRLIRDLFANKDAIFGELKRQSSAAGARGPQPATSVPEGSRSRAFSSDESNRRANFEERQRALRDRSRASSPGPGRMLAGTSSHKRDRSIGRSETRFPVATTPTSAVHNSPTERKVTGPSSRHSLEVPSSEGSPVDPAVYQPTVSAYQPSRGTPKTNGTSEWPLSADANGGPPSMDDGLEKRNSLGRSQPGARFSKRTQASSLQRQSLISSSDRSSLLSSPDSDTIARPLAAVELSDKPMDD